MGIFDVAGVPNPATNSVGGYGIYEKPTMSMASATDFGTTGASGVSTAAMFIPALTSLLGAGSAAADIKRQSAATIANIRSAGKQLRFSQHAKQEQFKELDRVIGDKLSASGLETLKREARLKAASAETGTSGTSVEEAIGEAFMEENFRTAAILREADLSKNNLKQSMVADLLGFESQTSAMIAGMPSPLSAGLQTFGAGVQGFQTGLSFLGQADRDRALGVDKGTTL